MLNSISAGPPQGPPSWNSSKPDKAEGSKESFDKTLAEKVSSKDDTKVSDRKVSSKDDKKEEIREKKPEQKEASSQDPLKKRAAVLRQKAIAGFMDSFESEFDVPPTRIVEAMAQLPTDDLEKNPEETADSVLAQLDLTEEQESKAKEMYLSLVSDLSRIDKSAQPPVVVTADANAMMGSQLKERFDVAQEKKIVLNQSLEKMNNNFFMKPGMQAMPANPEVSQSLEKGGESQNLDRAAGAAGFENSLTEDQAHLQDPSSSFQDRPVQQNPTPPTLPDSGKIKGGQGLNAENSKNASGTNLLEQMKKLSEQPSKPETLKSDALTQTPIQGSMAGMAMKNAQAQQQQGEGFSGKGSGKEGGKDGKESVTKSSGKSATEDGLEILGSNGDASTSSAVASPNAPPADASVPFRSSAAAGAAGVAARPAEGKEAHQDVNIRQIMNQAQYLIKKGGGEVKVEMSPEGLGQVHLKMAIHDGKVNLQMATETAEAKLAIESGMSDLKSSLAAHKLSVDHVKVDVVSGSSAGSAADNSQQSFNQHAQKDSTRQFWNQFEQNFGNRSRDEGLTDAPGLKGYGAQRRDPLAPVEGTSTAKRSVEGKGSGLNLVA